MLKACVLHQMTQLLHRLEAKSTLDPDGRKEIRKRGKRKKKENTDVMWINVLSNTKP